MSVSVPNWSIEQIITLYELPFMDLLWQAQQTHRAHHKSNGAQRFCMGAAWRSSTEKQVDNVIVLVKAVKALGMETCVTLGMLKEGQAQFIAQLANRTPYPDSVPINQLVKVAGTPMENTADLDELLTTANPLLSTDQQLFNRLGLIC